MTELLLFRHGPAEARDAERWPDDGLRPLTARGERRTRDAVRGMATLGLRPDLLLWSPLVRARQTAEIAHVLAATSATLSASDLLAPDGDARALLAAIADYGAKRPMLVGHSPDLERLASLLITGDADSASVVLRKAGLCRIRVDGPPAPGEGSLAALWPPSTLRRLARIR